MSTGFWIDNDGRPRQYGTQKAIPEMAGDYMMYGENREVEAYICLGATTFGAAGTLQVPGLPLTFSGTGLPIAAGIQSMTTMFPLQASAPVTQADANGNLILSDEQLYIDQVDFEVMIAATAGTGGATGIAGIGLALINPTTQAFAQVTPNAGVQIMGAATNAKMAAGMHYTFYADGSIFGTGGVTTANQPVAGSWLGRVPLVTNAITPLPTHGFLSVLTTGGPYTGTNAGGLMKVRIRYNYYGTINQ